MALVASKELADNLSLIPQVGQRQHLFHSLLHSYGLLARLEVVPPRPASEQQLAAFHSREYIEQLRRAVRRRRKRGKRRRRRRRGRGWGGTAPPCPPCWTGSGL